MSTTSSSPPWVNCEEVPPAHCSIGTVSCACVRFDKRYEALWTLDTSGYVSCLTMGDSMTKPGREWEWLPHSRFRPVKGPIGIGFSGNRARPLTTIMSPSTLHIHKAGGVSVFSATIEAQQQRKVQSFLALEKSAIFTGETPTIGVTRFDAAASGSSVLGTSASSPNSSSAGHTKYFTLDSSAFAGFNGVPVSNLQMCLPKGIEDAATESVVQKWLPIGLANGSVILCDHTEGFKTIGTSGRIFQTRVNAVRCADNSIVAVNSLGNTTTVKVFDARKITEPTMTINNIDGSLVDLDLFRNPSSGELEMLMVTPQMFYVLSTTAPTPIYRSFQIDNQSITSCSVTGNGRGSVIALTSGHFLTMRRVNNDSGGSDSNSSPSVASSPNSGGGSALSGCTFSNISRDPAVALHPPRPVAKPKWNIKTDIAAGFDHSKDPKDLFSAWPPADDYMILKVAEKHKAPSAFIRQVLESKEPPSSQDCMQLVSGRRIFAISGSGPLQRSDLYRADPKDKISRIIPNPYPFNCDVGTDPANIASLVIPKLKDLRAKRTGRDSKYFFCSEAEEALQVCYPLQGTFDWKSWNALPKDVIGVDNTLPESWISPIIQCMYLVHGPHFPVRHALIRHFCPRQDCVACELNIVFTNMIVASNGDGCIPIVQLGPLLAVLRRRKEFVESKIFLPARNRDEMVGKLHQAQSLLLQCLDSDFSAVVGAPSSVSAPPSTVSSPTGTSDHRAPTPLPKAQFADLPEPPEMTRIIKEYFGTQLEAQSPIDPILFWEMPPSAAKVEEGLTHVLKQVEYSRPRERIHIRALPPVLVILLNPDHGHLQPPPTLTFTRDKEEYSYTLCCQVHHLSDDVDDKGLFVSTHSWPKATARPETAQTTTGGNRNDTVLINDYVVTQPMTGKQFESCIPPSSSHSVALGYYSYDKFTQRSFTYQRGSSGNGTVAAVPPPPSQLTYKDGRRHLLNTWNFLGPLIIHDTISDAIPQPRAAKNPPRRFISSLDEVQPTDLIAIDAEYVIPAWGNSVDHSLQRRPYYLLARVSCIVSSHPGDERVLIDDYIATDEEIKDYVSQFSGIHRGDLCPASSPYPLTTRKANNMKLRALLDRGCKFVGHGLAQDFRVCNMQVPQSQTIDTVELFAKTKAAGGRKFALRLLAATLLSESIQEDEHDSIEDARTALRLYRRYSELHASGQLEAFVDTVVMGGAMDTPPRTATSPATLPRPSASAAANANAAPASTAASSLASPPSVAASAFSPLSSATPAASASANLTSAATPTPAAAPAAGSAFAPAKVASKVGTPSSAFGTAAVTAVTEAPAGQQRVSAFAGITPPSVAAKALSPSSFPAPAAASAGAAPTASAFPSKPVTPPLAPSAL